jgi:5-formyltetrahydrofolate cyclo-ligase
MTRSDIDQAKFALRQVAQARRSALTENFRAAVAGAIAEHLLAAHTVAGTVTAGYWPIRDEVDTRMLIQGLRDRGQTILLPAIIDPERPLVFRTWSDGETLELGPFGTRAPPAGAPEMAPDLILLPLLAFDPAGTRLGYGGGYYDRTIASLPRRPQLVGLAFEAQEMDELPRDTHDIALDAVVTEAGLRYFASP